MANLPSYCTSFWWRKVDGGEFRYQKHFQPRKPRSSTLPETSTAKVPENWSNPKKATICIPTIHFQVLELLVSGSSYDLFDTFLCVQFTTHNRFFLYFVCFRQDSFLKQNIWCIHQLMGIISPKSKFQKKSKAFEVSPIVIPRLWNTTPNWNTPLNGNLYHPGLFFRDSFHSWRCRGIAERVCDIRVWHVTSLDCYSIPSLDLLHVDAWKKVTNIFTWKVVGGLMAVYLGEKTKKHHPTNKSTWKGSMAFTTPIMYWFIMVPFGSCAMAIYLQYGVNCFHRFFRKTNPGL